MRKLLVVVAVAAMSIIPAGAALAADGTVSVIHGVPDLDVDIYVNGALTFENSSFGDTFTGVVLPEGDYEIEIYGAGADPAAGDPALASTVTLPGGANASIVAHLDEGGAPTLSVFVNNISEIAAGNGRVSARHVAAAPVVDILANDGVLFGGVPNGAGADADVPADTYNVKIVPEGLTEPVVFETDLTIPEGSNVIVYAIGSLEGGSFTVAAQTISGLGAAPGGVPTGTGGNAAAGAPAWLLAAAGLGALLVAAGGRSLARREN